LFYAVENRFSGLVPRSPFSGAHQSLLGPQLGNSAGFSDTFTKPMQTPDGETIAPTGKPFETCFTTIAKWKNERIVEEYVMLDPRDIMNQVVA